MKLLLAVLLLPCFAANSQVAYHDASSSPIVYKANGIRSSGLYNKRMLFQRNVGVIAGIQRGRNTAIELGGEAHWRKISVFKPHIIGATANMEYNFSSNVIGYKAGMWMKRGRINFTYCANVSYYDNFNGGSRLGFGPAVGFRLLGLHLINGYTFLTKDKSAASEKPVDVNSLYMSLRYYFPVENKFTWDKNTMKRKRERRNLREEKKKQKQKAREDGEKSGLQKLFGGGKKEQKEKEPEEQNNKGLKKLFKSKQQG